MRSGMAPLSWLMSAISSNLLDANSAFRLSASATWFDWSSRACTRGPCRTPHQSLVTVPAWGLSKERARSHVIGLVLLITLRPAKTALQLVVKERGKRLVPSLRRALEVRKADYAVRAHPWDSIELRVSCLANRCWITLSPDVNSKQRKSDLSLRRIRHCEKRFSLIMLPDRKSLREKLFASIEMVLKNLNVPCANANLLTACSTHDPFPVQGALSLCLSRISYFLVPNSDD